MCFLFSGTNILQASIFYICQQYNSYTDLQIYSSNISDERNIPFYFTVFKTKGICADVSNGDCFRHICRGKLPSLTCTFFSTIEIFAIMFQDLFLPLFTSATAVLVLSKYP